MLTVFVGSFWLVVIALLLAGAVLQALDILLDPTDRTAFRTWMVNFWISTADLHLYDQLQRALQSRYNRMRSLRFRFLQLFWFLAAAVIFAAAVEFLWLGITKEVANSFIHSPSRRQSVPATASLPFFKDRH